MGLIDIPSLLCASGDKFSKLHVCDLSNQHKCMVLIRLLHTCQPIQFTSIKYSFLIVLGGYGPTGKWIQENEQLTHAITKFTLAGLVQ